ncbi:hypothetical protein V6N11_020008 [Hibiscus sabdariffa]|uniref:Uncharacterized protein n=2 Tax=Hibiscus sabdariffa TaxID=183260 RepID=A0ABR2AJT9_9ROSI
MRAPPGFRVLMEECLDICSGYVWSIREVPLSNKDGSDDKMLVKQLSTVAAVGAIKEWRLFTVVPSEAMNPQLSFKCVVQRGSVKYCFDAPPHFESRFGRYVGKKRDDVVVDLLWFKCAAEKISVSV